MTDLTVPALPHITPAGGDILGIWDISGGLFGRCTRDELIGGTLTGGGTVSGSGTLAFTGSPSIAGNISGGGTIATAGFTLTVPATGVPPLLDLNNTFTNTQNILPSATNMAGINLNMPTSNAAYALSWSYAAGYRGSIYTQSAASVIELAAANLGNTIAGPRINVGHNNNGTVAAAGSVNLNARSGTTVSMWFDNSANLRGNTSGPPTSLASDTSGTVIGTQTSSLDSKNVLGEVCTAEESLYSLIGAADNALRRFNYKSGSMNNQEFEGVIIDYAPRYGMDLDEEHPAGKSLNEIVLFNDLIQSVALLARHVGLL